MSYSKLNQVTKMRPLTCGACELCCPFDLNIFSPLQSVIMVNYDPHKYSLKFPIHHLTVTASPKNICPKLYSGETATLDMRGDWA